MAQYTFIVSDESLVNSYGIRVMTSGIDLKQYKKNPLVMWFHKRPRQWDDQNHDKEVLPIGKAVKLWKEDGKLMADIEFDEEDEFAMKIAGKVERGYLNMCSPGLEPVTITDDAKYMLPGQTRATLLKSELVEISVVDVGSNKNALRLSKSVEQNIDEIIPLVHPKNENKMNEFKIKVATLLGLDPNASDESVFTAVEGKVNLAKNAGSFESKYNDLKTKLDEMNESRIIQLVDKFQDKKFTADKRDTFIKLGKESGYDTLKNVLEATAEIVKPGNVITPGSKPGEETTDTALTFAKLKEKGMKVLEAFQKEHRDEYIKLYRDEYGIDPELPED